MFAGNYACISLYNLLNALTYTAGPRFGIIQILYLKKQVSSAHQGCIYLIKNTVNTVLRNIITI